MDFCLQNGTFAYKTGNSFTKWDSPLQNGILGLQTGFSSYYSSEMVLITADFLFVNIKLLKNDKFILTNDFDSVIVWHIRKYKEKIR